VSPENNPEKLKSFRNIQKCIWWMSVDNYLFYHDFFFILKNFGLRLFLSQVRKKLFHFRKLKMDDSMTHFYQSEYAKDFLGKKRITEKYRLSDYLNNEYFNVDLSLVRNDVVLYNPRKGFEFTQRLIDSAPEISWRPLQNMTTEQVKEALLSSKVYIDFGNHPGKDRFPREAAACGCCVITGMRGSAKFFEDVPICNEFKFDEKKASLNDIISQIKLCLSDYEKQKRKFDEYRKFIKNERDVFINDVKSIFLTKH
jgi:hypothetical protein